MMLDPHPSILYNTHMENEIELYEWIENPANYDPYAPGGMARERSGEYDEDDEDDEFDYDADWRHEDAFLDSFYEDE